jgi:DNA-directed RNA polymerase specialized sigma24 family protein
VVLRYYDDLAEVDIAAAMRCRPGTVKSHLHRGIDALRKVIEP